MSGSAPGTKLKLGVIGAGVMGRNHLRAAKACEGIELVAVTDTDGERAQSAAAEFGCKALNAADLPDNIEAAVVAAPTASHMALAEPLLRVGVHCLIEKPFAASEADCRALMTTARAGNAILQVGHIERFNPAVEIMFAEVPHSSTVRKITARRLNPGSARVKDVDVIVDLMVHDLDVILALKAGVAVDHISARGNADEARAVITFIDGCVAMATASRLAKERVRDLNVMLSGGFVRLDYFERWIQVSRANDDDGLATTRPDVPAGESIVRQLSDFAACTREKRAPRVGGADALAVMRLAWQIQKEIAGGP